MWFWQCHPQRQFSRQRMHEEIWGLGICSKTFCCFDVLFCHEKGEEFKWSFRFAPATSFFFPSWGLCWYHYEGCERDAWCKVRTKKSCLGVRLLAELSAIANHNLNPGFCVHMNMNHFPVLFLGVWLRMLWMHGYHLICPWSWHPQMNWFPEVQALQSLRSSFSLSLNIYIY